MPEMVTSVALLTSQFHLLWLPRTIDGGEAKKLLMMGGSGSGGGGSGFTVTVTVWLSVRFGLLAVSV